MILRKLYFQSHLTQYFTASVFQSLLTMLIFWTALTKTDVVNNCHLIKHPWKLIISQNIILPPLTASTRQSHVPDAACMASRIQVNDRSAHISAYHPLSWPGIQWETRQQHSGNARHHGRQTYPGPHTT